MLSYNCWLFSLDWGPGLFHFLLTNISLFCLWASLSSPHLIWQFCLKSGCYYSDLVLEHSVVRVMWCDHELTRESSSEACSSEVFPLASLPEDFPMPTSTLGVTCGGGRDLWHKRKCISLNTHRLGPAVSEEWRRIRIAKIQAQEGVDLSPPGPFSPEHRDFLMTLTPA